MRFKGVEISNFKALNSVSLDALTDFILIAGPNGCGKSCILDAIRLLKSAYGGYQPHEWQQWFGEFQLDVSKPEELRKLARDSTKPVLIAAQVELLQAEATYIEHHLEDLITPIVWRNVTGQQRLAQRSGTASQLHTYTQQIKPQVDAWAVRVRDALRVPHDALELRIEPDGTIGVAENVVFDLVFQIYEPRNVGVIDYHSANRSYQRDPLGGIDLNISTDDQYAGQALYNSQARFQQVKTQLANTYIRELLDERSGVAQLHGDLNATVKDLFQTFFPDKEYLGVIPQPGGGLQFPIKTASGVHDINDLSSGEKEIVYGYLRLRSSAPQNSVILIDEPELHLNPSLLRGMPAFYHRNLGQSHGNQLWLVTHSDALLRHAVGNAEYSVFHMSAPGESPANQVSPVLADDELERATISLVGDLATYQPRSKVILFEGGGDADFDVSMTQRLFPDVAKITNMLSSGSKRRSRDLFDILEQTARTVGIDNRFFVIVDLDSDTPSAQPAGTRKFTWDVYHIENYLLSDSHILQAVNDLVGTTLFETPDLVAQALRGAARSIAPSVVSQRLRKSVNAELVGALNLGGNPAATDPVAAMRPALTSTFDRLRAAERTLIIDEDLESRAASISASVSEAIESDKWRSDLPGRDILKRFVATHLQGKVNYEAFRYLVIARMVDDDYRPVGMQVVLDQIARTNVTDVVSPHQAGDTASTTNDS